MKRIYLILLAALSTPCLAVDFQGRAKGDLTVDGTLTVGSTNIIAAIGAAGSTNNLASTAYVQAAVTNVSTNFLASTAYVAAAVTNTSTSGLASVSYVTAAVTNVSTNGLTSTFYVSQAVTNTSTGGLASVAYVTAAVTNVSTNGLASTFFVSQAVPNVSTNALAGTNGASVINADRLEMGGNVVLTNAPGGGGGGGEWTNFSYYSGIWPQIIGGNASQVVLTAGEMWTSNKFIHCGGAVTTTVAATLTTGVVNHCYALSDTLAMGSQLASTNVYWTTTTCVYDNVFCQYVCSTARQNRIIAGFPSFDLTTLGQSNIMFTTDGSAYYSITVGRAHYLANGQNPSGVFEEPNIANSDVYLPHNAVKLYGTIANTLVGGQILAVSPFTGTRAISVGSGNTFPFSLICTAGFLQYYVELKLDYTYKILIMCNDASDNALEFIIRGFTQTK